MEENNEKEIEENEEEEEDEKENEEEETNEKKTQNEKNILNNESEKKEIQKINDNNLDQNSSNQNNSSNNHPITENIFETKSETKADITKDKDDNEKIEANKNNDEKNINENDTTSTYLLKYTRYGDELKEVSAETGMKKSENCFFMLNLKLIKNESDDSKNYLVFCCHEVAAIYFDEIYEKIFTLDDLAKENKYFKVFESTEEAKKIIDETIRKNLKNSKKIFIGFKNKELRLHMKLSFFDEEKEIILNIPKKILNNVDKINLLPDFLKEIQDKMNYLNEENKKLKKEHSISIISKNLGENEEKKIDSLKKDKTIKKKRIKVKVGENFF
jgi:hypothetical protein